MLSKEFLKEAPGINPATGDPYTPAERDAEYEKTKAQGAKNLQGIKDFGSKISQGVKNFFKPAAPVTSMDDSDDVNAREFVPPAAAPAAPASNPEAELDPAIMRARYDQEAAARKAAPADAAPPPPGGEVRPVPSSTIQATPLAEPKSFSEPAAAPPAGAASAPMKGGYGSGMNNPSVAPKTAAAAPADDGPEQLGYSPDELERMQKNAGLATAATNAPKTVRARNPETGEPYDKLATDDGPEQLGSSPDELERMQKNAGLATAQPAAVDTAPVPASANASSSYTGTPAATTATAAAVDTAPVPDSANASSSYTGTPAAPAAITAAAAAPAQTAEPAPVKSFSEPAAAAPAASAAPAAPVDADNRRPGTLDTAAAAKYQPAGTPAAKPAAKSNPAVLKQQQELIAKGAKIKADGVMGPATQAAIKQFAAAPAASRSAAPAAGAGRGFVNPTAADTKAAVAAAKPAAKPAAPVKPTVKESQEINRMRFLAGLSKD